MISFETVNEYITTREAAEMYGVPINRAGMACCIFHDDHTPSMKIDKRFHCFGCGAICTAVLLGGCDFSHCVFWKIIGPEEAVGQLAFYRLSRCFLRIY